MKTSLIIANSSQQPVLLKLMNRKELNHQLITNLTESTDRKVAVIMALLLAICHSLWFAYEVGYTTAKWRFAEEVYGMGHHDRAPLYMQLRIGIALLVLVAGLWSRRAAGFWISSLASLYIGWEYITWCIDSRRWLKEVGIRTFSDLPAPNEIPHAGNLLGAKGWSLIVAGAVLVLFLCQMKMLLTTLLSRNPEKFK